MIWPTTLHEARPATVGAVHGALHPDCIGVEVPDEATQRRPVKTGTPGIYKKGNRYIDTWKERGKVRSQSYPTMTAAKRGRAERIAGGGRGWSRERFDRYATAWID